MGADGDFLSWMEEVLQLGAYAGARLHTGNTLEIRIDWWKCIKRAWNLKNERERLAQDERDGTIHFINDPED